MKVIPGNTTCMMCNVNYNRRTSYVSKSFYCHIPPEGPMCEAEHDLLARDKLLLLFDA